MTHEPAWLDTLRAIVRFWWVVLIGVILAAIVGASIGYHIRWGMPPELTARDTPTYTARAVLLVDGPESPLIRTGLQQKQPSRTLADGTIIPGSIETVSPDVKRYVTAANALAFLITGDAVVQQRKDLYGELPGKVRANALFASVGLKYRPGPLPYIEIVADGDTGDRARNLATATAEAFQTWLTKSQNKENVLVKDRYLIRIVERPASATSSGGTKPTLSIVAFLAIAGLSVLLAVMLDRMFPRGSARLPASRGPHPGMHDDPLEVTPPDGVENGSARRGSPVVGAGYEE